MAEDTHSHGPATEDNDLNTQLDNNVVLGSYALGATKVAAIILHYQIALSPVVWISRHIEHNVWPVSAES